MEATMPRLMTLPRIAAEHALNLDVLREVVRTRTELSTLGQKIGGSRAYAPCEVSTILVAMNERKKSIETRAKKAASR